MNYLVSLITLIAAALFGVATALPVTISQVELTRQVNEWREDNSYEPYMIDERLCSYAQTRLEETEYDLTHDKFYLSADAIFKITDYEFLGENLAQGYDSEKEMLQAWLDSPLHRENLEKNFNFSCIKCQNFVTGHNCTQIFGRRYGPFEEHPIK